MSSSLLTSEQDDLTDQFQGFTLSELKRELQLSESKREQQLSESKGEQQLSESKRELQLSELKEELQYSESSKGDLQSTIFKTIRMTKDEKFEALKVKKKAKRPEERKRRREKFKVGRQNGAPAKGDVRDEQLKRLKEAQNNNAKVCIDLQFEEFMNRKELNQLSNQLKRVYSANKTSAEPFHLYFTNLGGDIHRICCEKITGFDSFIVEREEKSVTELFEPENVVYLSPDADEELSVLEDDKVYVIGGIVDDTVTSQISAGYCLSAGLRCVKLPIDRYMQKGQTGGSFKQILTINQIFEILLRFYETQDWRVALSVGVPKKTGFVLKPIEA